MGGNKEIETIKLLNFQFLEMSVQDIKFGENLKEMRNCLECGNEIVGIVKEYAGIDLTEITEDDIVRVVEQMDPEAKQFLGQLFGVDVDAIIKEYKGKG